MAKGKKKKKGGGPVGETLASGVDETPKPAKPVAVGTSLKALLEGIKPVKTKAPPKVKPPSPRALAKAAARASIEPVRRSGETTKKEARVSTDLRGDDRIAYLDAFAGVRPLSGRAAMPIGAVTEPPVPTRERSDRDADARAALASLVSGGIRFDVHRDAEGVVEGARRNLKAGVIEMLALARVPNALALDLHGMRADAAEQRVVRFVRDKARTGVKRVRIVHGKGLHSASGGVLGDVVIRALTEGGAAPSVLAFVSARAEEGGTGALVVELTRS